MSAMPSLALHPAAQAALAARNGAAPGERASGAAKEFEAVLVNTMFQQMFSNIGKGPFSGGPGAAVWRSFLTDEYAKSFTQAGGLGVADDVRRALLAQQEVR